jgi:hypothetical protein
MPGALEIIRTPASGYPRAAFFTRPRSNGHRPDGPWLAITRSAADRRRFPWRLGNGPRA